MRYENLPFTDVDYSGIEFDLEIMSTSELIAIVDDMRKQKGYTDLSYGDNDVYYNIYAICSPRKNKIKLVAICNNGELDDYAQYELPMTSEEKEIVLSQAVDFWSKWSY